MGVYLRYLQALFDIIFPPREETLLVRTATKAQLLKLVSVRFVDGTYILLPYQAPLVKALVHEAKFHHHKKAYLLLGTALKLFLTTSNDSKNNRFRAAHATSLPKNTLVVPIPLSSRRARERGYNQVTEIIKAAGYTPTPLLLRTRHTPPQTNLDRAARLTNLAGAFAVDVDLLKEIDRSTLIILIDDVSTTGATLKEAVAALRAATFTNIECIALAH